MKAIFLADAHLKGLSDPNQKTLARFLNSLNGYDIVVILGDLFDFWAGYNCVLEEQYRPVLESFKNLKKKGTEIIYLEGNHDFSMRGKFARETGAKVFAEMHELLLNNKRFLLTHGDIVDKSLSYRLWRGFLRSPFFSALFNIVPAKASWRIAFGLSKNSRKRSKPVKANIIEPELVRFATEKIGQGFDFVVTGHSHAQGVKPIEAQGRKGIYANPGSFEANRSFLLFDGEKCVVQRYRG